MADPKFADNPWSQEHWNLTAQGAYVKKYGVEYAAKKAKAAGAQFGNYAPNAMMPVPRNNFTVIVQRRETIINQGGGTGGPSLPTSLATDPK